MSGRVFFSTGQKFGRGVRVLGFGPEDDDVTEHKGAVLMTATGGVASGHSAQQRSNLKLFPNARLKIAELFLRVSRSETGR